jgi:hypothetical protein
MHVYVLLAPFLEQSQESCGRSASRPVLVERSSRWLSRLLISIRNRGEKLELLEALRAQNRRRLSRGCMQRAHDVHCARAALLQHGSS